MYSAVPFLPSPSLTAKKPPKKTKKQKTLAFLLLFPPSDFFLLSDNLLDNTKIINIKYVIIYVLHISYFADSDLIREINLLTWGIIMPHSMHGRMT